MGKAEAWFFSYQVSHGTIFCKEFCEEICRRFIEADNSKFNLISEFKKLEQKGTIHKYLEKFAEY